MRHLFHFESRRQPLLPIGRFYGRLGRNLLAGALILAFCLGGGILGYGYFCGFTRVDSLLNASMILSGMGPVTPDPCMAACDSDSCKVFASLYALFSGVVFISTIGLIVAPIAHRIFHRFHIEEGNGDATG